MSQQTTLVVVVDRFERFIEKLPDVRALAGCSEERLRALWAGLGYYRRARNLKRGAELISGELRGRFPRDFVSWQKIPGCGPYTAAILASVCFGEPVPAVDGNGIRVASRILGLDKGVWSARGQRRIRDLLGQHIRDAVDPGDFNQAVMELGFAVCRKSAPDCGGCPIADHCLALEREIVDRCPPVRPRRAAIDTELLVVVISDASCGTVALGRRRGEFLSKTVGFPLLRAGSDEAIEAIGLLEQIPGASLVRTSNTFRHAITHHRIRGSVLEVRLSASAASRFDDTLWESLGVKPPRWHPNDEVSTQLSSSLDKKAWHTLHQEDQS
ncbi:MAG: A/G-specific adenine glycosylase [Deltaproteobacteria bacterium]|nr:A/G-specific adenine glycosylase [Deltaproteobacteria bacterium]